MSLVALSSIAIAVAVMLPLITLISWNRNRLALVSTPVGRRLYRLLDVAYVVAWCLFAAVLSLGLAPLVIAIPMALMVFSFSLICMIRVRDMNRRLLDDALSAACTTSVPLDQVAEILAATRTDPLALRAAEFSARLRAGQTPWIAAHECRLRLPLATQMILAGKSNPAIQDPTRRFVQQREEAFDLQSQNPDVSSMAFPWLVSVLPFVLAVVTFFLIKIVPTISMMLDEFGVEVEMSSDDQGVVAATTDRNPLVVTLSILRLFQSSIGAVWLIMVILAIVFHVGWWLLHRNPSNELLWRLPLIGPYYRDQHRSDLLDSLSLLVASGQSLDTAITTVNRNSSPESVSWPITRAQAMIQQGQSWTAALVKCRLIDRATAKWLQAAAASESLVRSLQSAAAALRRRAIRRRTAVGSVMVPAAVVLIAVPVFVVSYYLFYALSRLIFSL